MKLYISTLIAIILAGAAFTYFAIDALADDGGRDQFALPNLTPQIQQTATRTLCASGYYHLASFEAYNEALGYNRAGTRIDPNGDNDVVPLRHQLGAFGESWDYTVRVNCSHLHLRWTFYASDGSFIATDCLNSYEPRQAPDATVWDAWIGWSAANC